MPFILNSPQSVLLYVMEHRQVSVLVWNPCQQTHVNTVGSIKEHCMMFDEIKQYKQQRLWLFGL